MMWFQLALLVVVFGGFVFVQFNRCRLFGHIWCPGVDLVRDSAGQPKQINYTGVYHCIRCSSTRSQGER